MKKNIKLYKQNIKRNINDIEEVLDNLKINDKISISIYEKMLTQSVNQVTDKWESGKKYCRTHFIQEAFGKKYPEKLSEISLLIDSMVNILDDFFDENLNKETRGQMLIEYLRIFSLFNYSFLNKKIQLSLGKYFNQLITLALAEDLYQNRILKNSNFEDIINDSVELLLCRGMDIDIFIEIALMDCKNRDTGEKIKKIARVFRAINIFKKDIKDINHDKKNNINTVTITILDKKIDFSKYSNDLIKSLISNIDFEKEDTKDQNYGFIFNNFTKMINAEKREIFRIRNY
ncbi:hypothetical protein K8R62_03445 [bacterium]|nr:hypothetical protein [bacterium]